MPYKVRLEAEWVSDNPEEDLEYLMSDFPKGAKVKVCWEEVES